MNRILGISFISNKIHFTELTADSSKPKLEHLETVEVDFNFDEDLSVYKSNQKVLTNISNELKSYIARRKVTYDKISATIGTSQAFMLILPIDFSEGKQTINSKIYWELSNYFPDNYNDFVINTYRLNSFLPCSKTDEYMIIAVPKNTIEFIKRLSKLSEIVLTLVDIDQFASEYALRCGYAQELENINAFLVGIKNRRIDYGWIEKRKFKYYSYSTYSNNPEFNLSLIRKISSLMKSDRINNAVEKIFLYGEVINDDTLDALRKFENISVEIMNPLLSVSASSEFLKDDELRKIVHRYSSSTGIALRTISQGL